MPTNALALCDEFKIYLSEDFLRDYNNEETFNRALICIEDVLHVHNLSFRKLRLPVPTYLQRTDETVDNDPLDEEFREYYQTADIEQRDLIGRVFREVLQRDIGSNVLCLTDHAGCGKTFAQSASIHKLNSPNLRCSATAFSGIASTLLLGGITLHNVFKLPIPITENSGANINAISCYGRYINSSSLTTG